MTPTVDLSAILALPVEQRRAIAEAIIDTLPEAEPDEELSDELKEELDRRLADYRANPERGVPWEEVYAKAIARIKS
jgi:putative addiction module component (TIGR02574 family)